MKKTKRWLALLLAVMLAVPNTAVLRAEELTAGEIIEEIIDEEQIYNNEIEELEVIEEEDAAEDTEELLSDVFSEEELCDDLESVSANGVLAKITGCYNSAKGGDIRWDKVIGATGYVLYRNRQADGLKKVATINNPDTLQYIDAGIKDNCWGRVYTYYVKPLYGTLEGLKSNEVTLQRLAPMKITKNTSSAAGQISLTWACTTTSNKAVGYEIQYATSTSDLYNQKGSFQKISVSGRNNLSRNLSGLTKGQTYYFRVRGYVNYTHSVTGKTTKTWSQYSDVKDAVAGEGASGTGNVSTYVISSYTYEESKSMKETVFFTYRSDGLIDSARVEAYYYTTKSSNTTLLRFEYNSEGQLTGIYIKYYNSSSYKKVYTLNYDNDGNIKAVNKITLQYQNNRLTTASHSKYSAEHFEYNSSGQLIKYQDALGGIEDITWDAKNNRLTRRYSYRGTSALYQYQNTYSNDLLIKQTKSFSGKVYDTWSYNYIPISISSYDNNKIEKQQWAIRNGDYYFTLGRNGLVTAQ